MTDQPGPSDRRRMEEIEDRRIGILLRLAELNEGYGQEVARLRAEYARLTDEYHRLRMERIGMRAGEPQGGE